VNKGQILAQIPSLRRYAGCLTGSDREGDALVATVLQRIVDRELALERVATSRIALFRALHRVWVPVDTPPSHGDDDAATGRVASMLRMLPPLERATMILTRLEGFRLAEAGSVLRVPVATARRWLEDAERKLRYVLVRRIMIVEDDALTAMELEQLVTVLGHKPIGPAVTRKEAVDLALREEPDLILSDVCLDDGTSGVDAVREIRHTMHVPVIFLTAFPDHLADRRLIGDSYVIPKPFDDRLVTRFITNALLHRDAPTSAGSRLTS
jgi:CheY-like chemotaxis protein